MRRLTPMLALALLLAGCGGGAGPASAPAASAPPKPVSAAASAAASAKPAASASAKPAAAASAKPAASAAASAKPAASAAAQANPSFTDGTVASADATKLTLAEGNKTFTITPQTTFRKLEKQNASDIKPGQFVAITAKQQPDGTMLASFLRVQDTPGPNASQFPMDYIANGQPQPGNLMINAPIKSADANGMVVTLSGGDATIKYAPNVEVRHQADGSASDLAPGKKVLVIARGDTAASIGIYV
jgi:hypothetical protein